MLSYMKRLNLPIASGEDWNEDDFDVQTLFNYDQHLAFGLFFDMEFTFRPGGVRYSEYYISKDTARFQKKHFSLDSQFHQHLSSDMLNSMKPLHVGKQMIKEAIKDFTDFLEAKLPFEEAANYDNGNPHNYPDGMDFSLYSKLGYWRNISKHYLIHLGIGKLIGLDQLEKIDITLYNEGLLKDISNLFDKLSKR